MSDETMGSNSLDSEERNVFGPVEKLEETQLVVCN
jgi:hypothetical protein